MIISKGMACTLMQSFLMSLRTNQSAAGLLLCVGTPPTDTEVLTLTPSSAVVTNNLACTFNTSGLLYGLYSATEFPPRYILTGYPSTNTVNSTKAGTISWAVLYNAAWGSVVVDVTETNGGGIIEIDNKNVAVGTPVTLTNWSFKLDR